MRHRLEQDRCGHAVVPWPDSSNPFALLPHEGLASFSLSASKQFELLAVRRVPTSNMLTFGRV